MRHRGGAIAVLVFAAACSRSESPLDPVQPPPPPPPPTADYVVTDMGIALGGAVVLSDDGVVAGEVRSDRPFTWHDGVLTMLPAAWGTGAATAIGPGGVIGGTSYTESGRYITVWEHGTMRLIGPDTGWAELAQVVAINNRGDILTQISYSTSHDGHAVIWRGGVPQPIGHMSQREDTRAMALNNLGQVVGFSATGTGVATGVRPFIWSDGIRTDLGTLGGGFAFAVDVNDRSEVVGFSDDRNGKTRPFIWRNGVMQDLGAFPDENVMALRINNSGQVLAATQPLNGYPQPFLWKDGVVTMIGPAGTLTAAVDINDRGEVVGFTRTRGRDHAFVWREGILTDLGTGALEESAALLINERGDIVGFSGAFNGERRGIFWSRR